MNNWIDFIFNKRWTFGGVLLLLCVIFEIHGSSMGIYADIMQHPELSDIIAGKYRPIRSDEWLVFTPFAFSQYFNNFEMISDIIRGTATNVFLVYGQAVWNLALIYRPAQIGYLFLDAGSGLAFFWMGRLIILFLVSFEFAQRIIQVNKKLSVLYAIMVAFSPAAQWWWSVNSIAEILAASQGLVVFWNLYLENVETSRRFIFGLGFLWCAGILIWGIYPAWQVSCGYVALIAMISVALDYSKILKTLWNDKFFWIIGVAVMIAPILHVLYISQDIIQLQLNTEYPGRRFFPGGTYPISQLMIHSIGAVLPFSTIQAGSNNCEVATFYSMAPLSFIMFFWASVQLQKLDKLSCFLIGLIIFFSIFELFGFPNFLIKITLMGNVTDGRLRIVIDWLQVILMFRSLKFITEFPTQFKRLVIAELIAVASAVAIYEFLPDWFHVGQALHAILFLTIAGFLFMSPMNKKNAVILAIMMLSIGATVNPINAGVDTIYKMPVGQKISEIVQQETSNGQKKSLWITESAHSLKNFPIMFGAPSINCVNIYPALERWKKLDPDGSNFKIYNRYAHIDIELRNEPTEFNLIGADCFRINLNVSDLKTLEVNYILSNRADLENLSLQDVSIIKIYEDAGSFIYKVN